MALVWKRPGLTGLELLWRWSAGVPLIALALVRGGHALHGIHLDTDALGAMTVFQPVAAMATLRQQMLNLMPFVVPLLRWLLPLSFMVWALASTAGRSAIWRRLDHRLHPPPGPVLLLGLVRLGLLAGVLALWLLGIVAAARYTVTAPARSGAEPNLVLLSALVVGLSLVLFLAWSLLVWPLDAAPLFLMAQGRGMAAGLRAAVGHRELRSKLIEINLVMGIVKVGLLVLAMVFCATPLPFASEESTAFLVGWWSLIFVLFLMALDLFHVVRRAAYLSFFRALVLPAADRKS